MASIRSLIDRLSGTLGLAEENAPSTPANVVNNLFKHVVVVSGFAFEADDNTQRQVLFKNPFDFDLRLVSAEFVPEAAVTAHDTNFSTVELAHQAAPAGTLGDVAASMQTTITAGTGDWVANTPEALTKSSTFTDLILEAGHYAVVELDGTAGTGVDLPIGTWVLVYEVN